MQGSSPAAPWPSSCSRCLLPRRGLLLLPPAAPCPTSPPIGHARDPAPAPQAWFASAMAPIFLLGACCPVLFRVPFCCTLQDFPKHQRIPAPSLCSRPPTRMQPNQVNRPHASEELRRGVLNPSFWVSLGQSPLRRLASSVAKSKGAKLARRTRLSAMAMNDQGS